MKDKTSAKKKLKKSTYCKNCGNNKGMIHRYGINLCRRCFKELAEKVGFKKLN